MSILLKQHDCYRRGNGGMLRKNLTMYTTVFTTGWATVKSFSFISNLCSVATKPFLLIIPQEISVGPLYHLAAGPKFSRLDLLPGLRFVVQRWGQQEVCYAFLSPCVPELLAPSLGKCYRHFNNYMGQLRNYYFPYSKKILKQFLKINNATIKQ